MLNLATSKGMKGNTILKYCANSFSVMCEYLVNSSKRVKNAGFSSMRMIIEYGIK